MGTKCFRPVIYNNQPIYESSINNALDQAQKKYLQKKSQKQLLINEIIKNENRKGHLKKLFDHLVSHQKNILPSIKFFNKRAAQEKSLPCVVVGSMFCEKLVKILAQKKIKFIQSASKLQNSNNKSILSAKNLFDQNQFRNLLHQLQSYFFQLISKVLIYGNRSTQIQNSISQTIIKYSKSSQQKIRAKRQFKDLLDLYFQYVLERNIQSITKHSYISYYAYSSLLSRSKSQLFTGDFIKKHFNFILKLFFELENCRNSNQSISQSDNFLLFQECVERIVKEFILFSSQNQKIKQYILNQIIIKEDIEKFQTSKSQKLERAVKQCLNSFAYEHFMFDWLGYLIRYISKKIVSDNQSLKDSIQDFPQFAILNSLKNIVLIESKVNSIETLKRWFDEQLLDSEKALKYYSEKIFQALLRNLYNSSEVNNQLNQKAQQVLIYILQKKPLKLGEIITMMNRELRKSKNQFYFPEHHNLIAHLVQKGKKQFPIIQQDQEQIAWQNDIIFIQNQVKDHKFCIRLSDEQIQEIYSPVQKYSRLSINLIYLIQLAGVGLNYVNLKLDQTKYQISNFLISLTNAIKIVDAEIQLQYQQKIIKKMSFLFHQLNQKNQIFLLSFLRHNLKNVLKQKETDQVWIEVLIMIIVINVVIQSKINSSSKRFLELSSCQKQILQKIKLEYENPVVFYKFYQRHKKLLDIQNYYSNSSLEKILKEFQLFQNKISIDEIIKSATNIDNSVLSSKFQSAQQNNDSQFKYIIQMVSSP